MQAQPQLYLSFVDRRALSRSRLITTIKSPRTGLIHYYASCRKLPRNLFGC